MSGIPTLMLSTVEIPLHCHFDNFDMANDANKRGFVNWRLIGYLQR